MAADKVLTYDAQYDSLVGSGGSVTGKVLPSVSYGRTCVWTLNIKIAGAVLNLSTVTTFRFTIGVFSADGSGAWLKYTSSAVDATNKATGVLICTFSTLNSGLKTKLNGLDGVNCYFELWGADSASPPKEIFCARFPMFITNAVDPDAAA